MKLILKKLTILLSDVDDFEIICLEKRPSKFHTIIQIFSLLFQCFFYYRPQRSREGYVFTPVCQSFFSRGGSASVHAGIPHGTRPPQPNRRLLLRTVRILLKCILVFVNFLFMNRVNQSYCEASNTPL